MSTSTIKRLLPFLILLAFVVYSLDAQIVSEFPNGAATKTQLDNEVADIDAKIAIIQESIVEGNLKYYYTKDETVAGTRDFSITAPPSATEAVSFVAATTEYVAYTVPHISPALGIATLSQGEISTIRYFASNQKISTNRAVSYVSELYFADADGTNQTFIATSTACEILGLTPNVCTRQYVISADTSTGGTDRVLLEKHYWKRTGTTGGADPTITVYCGGQYAGYLTLQVPSAVVMKTDGSNASTTINFPGTDVKGVNTIQASTSAGIQVKCSNGITCVTFGVGGLGVTFADGIISNGIGSFSGGLVEAGESLEDKYRPLSGSGVICFASSTNYLYEPNTDTVASMVAQVDSDGQWSNTTSTFTAARSGFYMVSGALQVQTTATGEYYYLKFNHNSTLYIIDVIVAESTRPIVLTGGKLFYLAANDTVNLVLRSSTSAQFDINYGANPGNAAASYFSIVYLGD